MPCRILYRLIEIIRRRTNVTDIGSRVLSSEGTSKLSQKRTRKLCIGQTESLTDGIRNKALYTGTTNKTDMVMMGVDIVVILNYKVKLPQGPFD